MDSTTKILLFGDKNLFAFELEPGITGIKGYLKLWFRGTPIGNNKRQSEYVHAMFDFRKFYITYETLYEDVFESMTPEQINEYTSPDDLINSEDLKDLEEAERRQIYIRFFGDQFDGLCSFTSIYKEGIITFILWFTNRKSNEYETFDIPIVHYTIAVNEFKRWFKLNLAQYYPSLNFNF